MTPRKREDNVNRKRKHYMALCGGMTLEDAMNLSYDKTRE
jgi:hypothetical protein